MAGVSCMYPIQNNLIWIISKFVYEIIYKLHMFCKGCIYGICLIYTFGIRAVARIYFGGGFANRRAGPPSFFPFRAPPEPSGPPQSPPGPPRALWAPPKPSGAPLKPPQGPPAAQVWGGFKPVNPPPKYGPAWDYMKMAHFIYENGPFHISTYMEVKNFI